MLEEFCNRAYLNGIKELYDSRHRKCHLAFWLLVMIIVISCSIYFVVKVVGEYIGSPTVTRISMVPNASMEMPEIMLCFNGGFKVNDMISEGFSSDLIYVLSGSLSFGTVTFDNLTLAKIELDAYLRNNNTTIDKLYETFSYQCSDMVEFYYPASTDRFFENRACVYPQSIISPVYGRCLIYRNNSQQFWPGLNGGVRAVLKFPQDSMASLFPQEALLSDKSLSYAISLEKKFKIQTERFVLIPANAKVELILNAKHNVRLPQGSVGCSETAEYDNLCSGRCYADGVYITCGCVPFKYFEQDGHYGKRICTPFEEVNCTTYDIYTIPCQSNCMPACDEWIFESTISYGIVSNLQGSNSIQKSSVWIGFETLQYSEINEIYAYSAVDAIANVGAQLGLWLGVSIVSIVQALYYIYMACCRAKEGKIGQNGSASNVILVAENSAKIPNVASLKSKESDMDYNCY